MRLTFHDVINGVATPLSVVIDSFISIVFLILLTSSFVKGISNDTMGIQTFSEVEI